MSKRKAKAPTTKNIVDGTRPMVDFGQPQMFTVNIDRHLLYIIQKISTHAAFRKDIQKLLAKHFK